MPAAPGGTFTADGWFKIEGFGYHGFVQLAVVFSCAKAPVWLDCPNGTDWVTVIIAGDNFQFVTQQNVWVHATGTATVPEGAQYCYFKIFLYRTIRCHVDDVRVNGQAVETLMLPQERPVPLTPVTVADLAQSRTGLYTYLPNGRMVAGLWGHPPTGMYLVRTSGSPGVTMVPVAR